MADEQIPAQQAAMTMPVEEVILNAARSVVEAQRVLDAASLEAEVQIRQQGLDRLGLAARWYTIPELTLSLKLAFEIGSLGELKTQMVDADYQSRYGFNLKASSLLETRIVAAPAAEPEGLSLLAARDVLRAVGRIKQVVVAHDEADAPRFEVRYVPFVRQGYAGGLWFVWLLDTSGEGEVSIKALSVVDDGSGDVVRLWITRAEP